ncbi:hypothetical protein Henu3_gp15 [Mycobacterium phage Henu3]|uniref:Uncharacterized protein n=1 Tax=Mycobacterium phage Henu3 TaxID=2492961 RepID=A0A410T7T3_9CAUD|nr:hypothetical protein I5G68_gp13 [Mycobacterium phage Henu3]QAU04960.1 hypothetical protein Henu3_gp15 [Mycobacterium phage Henu3]
MKNHRVVVENMRNHRLPLGAYRVPPGALEHLPHTRRHQPELTARTRELRHRVMLDRVPAEVSERLLGRRQHHTHLLADLLADRTHIRHARLVVRVALHHILDDPRLQLRALTKQVARIRRDLLHPRPAANLRGHVVHLTGQRPVEKPNRRHRSTFPSGNANANARRRSATTSVTT